jgi:hypothetical protein
VLGDGELVHEGRVEQARLRNAGPVTEAADPVPADTEQKAKVDKTAGNKARRPKVESKKRARTVKTDAKTGEPARKRAAATKTTRKTTRRQPRRKDPVERKRERPVVDVELAVDAPDAARR